MLTSLLVALVVSQSCQQSNCGTFVPSGVLAQPCSSYFAGVGSCRTSYGCSCDAVCELYGDCCTGISVCRVPTVISVSPSVMDTTGALLTIAGYNFGATEGSVQVGSEACVVSSWAATQIRCAAPPGVGFPALTVTTSLGVSNAITLVHRNPRITAVSPSTLPTTGGTVTLTGTDFGPSTAPATLSGTLLANVTAHSHTSLTLSVAPGVGTGWTLSVSVGGLTSNEVRINYAAPVLSSVTPATLPALGGTLTLFGSGFGAASAPLPTVTVGGAACTPVSRTSDSQLSCTAPAGFGGAPVVVTLASQASNALAVTYPGPSLTSATPTLLPTVGGAALELAGTSLDAPGLSVLIGSAPCPITNVTATLLRCTAPAGTGRDVPVRLTWQASTLSSTVNVSYLPPVITSVAPAALPTAGGASLVIAGHDFGASGAAVTVDGVSCLVVSQSGTSLTCLSPVGAGVSRPVVVTVSQQSSNASLVSFLAPTLSDASAPGASTAGGTTLTLTGTNLGISGGTILVGGLPCPLSGARTHSQVSCTLPAGAGGTVPVTFTLAGQSASTSFTWPAPTLVSAEPMLATSGGDTLFVTGTNLGNGQATSVTVGGQPCVVSAARHTSLECTLPAGQGTVPLVVTVNGVSASSTYAYAAPLLTSLSGAGPTAGGSTLVLHGASLGVTGATVSVGASSCPVTAQSHTQVSCTLPAGQGTNLPVVLTVGGRASNALTFSYDAPTLLSLSGSATTAGGTTLVLQGTSLGSSGATVSVGASSCPVTAQSHTQVSCTLAAGQGTNLPVVLTLNGRASNALTFSYDAPTLVSLSGSATTAGGTTLVLQGTSLGTSATVSVGASSCAVTAQSHTQVSCTLPAGQGTNLPVVLTLGGRSSNALTFSYDAPTLLSLSGSGTTAGGSLLTLDGAGFGTSATVMVGAQPCVVQPPQTHTRLRCLLPSGAGANLAVVVTVAGQSSNARTFSYDAPVLSGLSGSSTTAGGTALVLTGTSLGASGATISVGGASCPVTAQSHTQATCTLPAGQGVGVAVVLTVGTQASNPLTFSYDAPVLSALSGTGSTAGGTTLTLLGTSLGTSGATVSVGGASCPVSSQSHTQVSCTLPGGQGVSVPVVLTLGARSSNALTFSYDAPLLISVMGSAPTAGGTTLTLSGSSFGASGGTVLVGGLACPVTSQSHVQVQCTLPAGEGSAPVVLTVGGRTSNAVLLTYDAPALLSVSGSGATAGGSTLTLTGSSFGASGATVSVGGAPCAVTAQSHTQVQCTLPPGQGTVPVVLTLGTRSSNAVMFSYDAPTLSSVTGAAPTSGGSTLLLTGSNFGSSATVSIDGVACPVSMQTSTQVRCTLAAGQGRNLPVVVTVATQRSNAVTFSYEAPTLSSVTGTGPTTGGSTLTLTGLNFGLVASVTIGGVSCPVTMQQHSQLECTLPAGEGAGLPVVVTCAGQASNSLSFSYSPPSVTRVTPRAVPTRGGTLLLIEGRDFGGAPTVTLGGVACPVLQHTAREVQCAAPAGMAGTADVVVSAGQQVSNAVMVSRVSTCGVELGDGMACDDGNPCTDTGACRGTACVAVATNEGQPCAVSGACASDGECRAGSCVATVAAAAGSCLLRDGCHAVGVCNGASCVAPALSDGVACFDETAGVAASCSAGRCIADAGGFDAGGFDAGGFDAGEPVGGGAGGGGENQPDAPLCAVAPVGGLLWLGLLLVSRRCAR